jgi:hypothetical protein
MNVDVIPIFIISFNRLFVLKRSIESYRQVTGHTLVIHDTGSTYGPLLEYLAELEQEGATVYRGRRPIARPEDLNSVHETVQHWLELNPRVNYYVVTDPDVLLEEGCSDIFEFYRVMLEAHKVDVVGPMLRIDDIPNHYPLKQRVISKHTQIFWHKTPELTLWKSGVVGYQHADIDTTFGMYPRRVRFRRLLSGIRTYRPYWAKHLDWYIDPGNMTEDQKLYLQSASDVSHWGGPWLRNELEHAQIPLRG